MATTTGRDETISADLGLSKKECNTVITKIRKKTENAIDPKKLRKSFLIDCDVTLRNGKSLFSSKFFVIFFFFFLFFFYLFFFDHVLSDENSDEIIFPPSDN